MKDRVVLVTGGTGSFGKRFVNRVIKENPKKIIVFSRDEDKQHRMRQDYPDIQFEIGDVRDRDRVFEVVRGVDYIFHAAALKQVPSSEFFPMEAVKTNVIGTNNVLDASRDVEKIVCLSTDKAAYPINAMGMSKAIMEKLAVSKSRNTNVCITRYGNVMCSRGSVIPIWHQKSLEGAVMTVTEPTMTRFLLSIDDAVDLVVYALEHGNNGDILIKKAPACTMGTLAQAVKELSRSKSKIETIGMRHGEKMHETLIGEEEMLRTEDCGGYFRIKPDSRELNYGKFFSQGQVGSKRSYTSYSTNQLTKDEVKEVLLNLGDMLNGV